MLSAGCWWEGSTNRGWPQTFSTRPLHQVKVHTTGQQSYRTDSPHAKDAFTQCGWTWNRCSDANPNNNNNKKAVEILSAFFSNLHSGPKPDSDCTATTTRGIKKRKRENPPRQVTKCHFHLSSASSRSVFNTTVVRQLQGNTHTGWFSRKGQPVLTFHATQLLGHFTSWCLIVRSLQPENGSSFKKLNCSQSKPPILHHLDSFSIDRK